MFRMSGSCASDGRGARHGVGSVLAQADVPQRVAPHMAAATNQQRPIPTMRHAPHCPNRKLTRKRPGSKPRFPPIWRIRLLPVDLIRSTNAVKKRIDRDTGIALKHRTAMPANGAPFLNQPGEAEDVVVSIKAAMVDPHEPFAAAVPGQNHAPSWQARIAHIVGRLKILTGIGNLAAPGNKALDWIGQVRDSTDECGFIADRTLRHAAIADRHVSCREHRDKHRKHHASHLPGSGEGPRSRRNMVKRHCKAAGQEWQISMGLSKLPTTGRKVKWCPEEDSNLHALASAAT